VGVNAYIDEREETTVPVLSVPPGSLEAHLVRLEKTRREREPAAVEAALAGLREAASRAGSSEANLMPHFIRCAEAYATLGEQCAVLRGVFGEYREPAAV
jgi:methylmalonyl-CoA mutase, N-terminal domain